MPCAGPRPGSLFRRGKKCVAVEVQKGNSYVKEWKVNSLHRDKWLKSIFHFSIPYFETSAVTGVDVERSVTSLLDLVMKRMEQSTYGDHTSEPNGSREVEEAPVRRRCAC